MKTNMKTPTANKLERAMAYDKGHQSQGHVTRWSRGYVKSSDKLKTLYILLDEVYGKQT